MGIHYLHGHHPTDLDDAWHSSASKADKTRIAAGRDVTDRDVVGNALAVTERSPGWNNRKPGIVRIQLGHCTLLAVPYRRWAWRRYELRVAESRSQEVQAAAKG
jgi:hypothetical protein